MEKIASANEANAHCGYDRRHRALPLAAHSHGEEEEHAEEGHAEHEEGLDPNVWTSPELVKIQSQIIYETLGRLDPDHQQAYKTNLDTFIAAMMLWKQSSTERCRTFPVRSSSFSILRGGTLPMTSAWNRSRWKWVGRNPAPRSWRP
jgi:ABC-type Zn uptake system ZnuABC Zn-binding protein ZnuA